MVRGVNGIRENDLALYIQNNLPRSLEQKNARKYVGIQTEDHSLHLTPEARPGGRHDYVVTLPTKPPTKVTVDSENGKLVQGKFGNKSIELESLQDLFEDVKAAVVQLVRFANIAFRDQPKQSIGIGIGQDRVQVNEYSVIDSFSPQLDNNQTLVTFEPTKKYKGPTLDNPVVD